MNVMLSRLVLLPAALLGCASLTSCGLFKKDAATTKTKTNSGAYASYPADGHYNPYPDSSQKPFKQTTTRYEEYTDTTSEADEPPAPPKPKASSSKSKKSSASVAASTAKKKPASTTSSKSTGSGTGYTVKRGDTLYGLSRKYHTTVSKLKSVNGLSSDLIRDGQKLKIP